MSRFFKLSIFVSVLAIAFAFAFSATPAQASEDTFDIYVKHNINGRSLGLDKALPVDVYINGGDYPAFYSIGRIVAKGDLEAIYNPENQAAEQKTLMGKEAGYLPFGYPPYVALFYWPLP